MGNVSLQGLGRPVRQLPLGASRLMRLSLSTAITRGVIKAEDIIEFAKTKYSDLNTRLVQYEKSIEGLMLQQGESVRDVIDRVKDGVRECIEMTPMTVPGPTCYEVALAERYGEVLTDLYSQVVEQKKTKKAEPAISKRKQMGYMLKQLGVDPKRLGEQQDSIKLALGIQELAKKLGIDPNRLGGQMDRIGPEDLE